MPSNKIEQFSLHLEIPEPRSVRLMGAKEIYEKIDEKLIVELVEDRRFERKVATIQARALGDYFSIFANTPPDGGVIGIGIDDGGKITGTRRVSAKHLGELERAGDVYCPDARYECKPVTVLNSDGKPDQILVIHVKYRDDKVVETTDGHAYIRRGESRRKLSDEEKRDLKNAKGQLDVERESVSLDFPSEFKTNLLEQFVATVRDARGLPHSLSTPEILELRHLGKVRNGTFVPNLACALLFAKDPGAILPGCRIRFLRYDGEEEKTGAEYNVTKNLWVEGTVPELIRETEKILDGQVRDFSRLGPDNQFYVIPEYPKTAWYEAIVNACVHRSYAMRNMNIFVKMFDDRLVVESPGGFPPFVTPQNIYDMHEPRNAWLMDAMFYLKFVQCAHEGTRRIRDDMKSQGLPAPEFSQADVGGTLVRVTLRNDIKHRKVFVDSDAFNVLGETLARTLDDNERRIVNFVAENRTINVTQAKNLLNRRWQFTKKVLVKMTERKILDHIHDPIIERDAFAYFTLKKKFSDKIRREVTDAKTQHPKN